MLQLIFWFCLSSILLASASISPKPDLAFDISGGSTTCNGQYTQNQCQYLDSYIPIPDRPELVLNFLKVYNYKVSNPWSVIQLLDIKRGVQLSWLETRYAYSRGQFLILNQTLPTNRNRAALMVYDSYGEAYIYDYYLTIHLDDPNNITVYNNESIYGSWLTSSYASIQSPDEKVYVVIHLTYGDGSDSWNLFYFDLRPGNMRLVKSFSLDDYTLISIDMTHGAFNNDFDNFQLTCGCIPYNKDNPRQYIPSICTFNEYGGLLAEQVTNSSYTLPIYYQNSINTGMYINYTYAYSLTQDPLTLVDINYNEWFNMTVPQNRIVRSPFAINPTYAFLQFPSSKCIYTVAKSVLSTDIGIIEQYYHDQGIKLMNSLHLTNVTLGKSGQTILGARLYGDYLYLYFSSGLYLNRYPVSSISPKLSLFSNF